MRDEQRGAPVRSSNDSISRIRDALFPEQQAFVFDRTYFKTAVCSRRAGKTIADVAALLVAALDHPGSTCIFISLTRVNAKRTAWRPLLDMNRDLGLRGKVNETELRLELPNGSVIYMVGASDRSEIDKLRGPGLALVIVDEAQSFPSYFAELIDAVLAPALMDYDGSLMLTGTPGPVPGGYFWDCCHKDGWGHHSWTVWKNPIVVKKSNRTVQQMLDKETKRRGLTESDPIIRREWFGEWAYDEKAQVFSFLPGRNVFNQLPKIQGQWQHVMGIDLGYDDADAISVLAWCDERPEVYLVEESVLAKQTITELGKKVKEAEDRYHPIARVIDTGGLGKKITQELEPRLGLSLEAADKARKLEHIELLNDALRSGRFLAKANSRFAADCVVMEWDKSVPEKPKIPDRCHSDITDSVLYAYVKCLHWLYKEPEDPGPQYGTHAWQLAEEKRIRLSVEEAANARIDAAAEDAAWDNSMEDWN